MTNAGLENREKPLPPVQGPVTSFDRPDHLDHPEKTAGSGSTPATKKKFNDVSSSNNE